MKVNITENLRINLDGDLWECRKCDHSIAPARENYKTGLLVYNRDPRDIHKPLINPELYKYTFSPDPKYTAILEFYCPACGAMIETEYTVPGHPPVHDIELDIDDLRKKARHWGERPETPEIPDVPIERHVHHH